MDVENCCHKVFGRKLHRFVVTRFSVRFLKFWGPAVGRPHPWRERCGKRKVWSRKRGIKASSDVMSRGDWEADEPAKCVTFLYIDTFVIACVSRFCTMCALKEM